MSKSLLLEIKEFLEGTIKRIDEFKKELNGSYEKQVKQSLDKAKNNLSETIKQLEERKESIKEEGRRKFK